MWDVDTDGVVAVVNRLWRCEADGCGAALVDLTKNRSRRFCDTACANRTHAAVYRARRAETTSR